MLEFRCRLRWPPLRPQHHRGRLSEPLRSDRAGAPRAGDPAPGWRPLRLRVSSNDGNPISLARLAAIKIHSAASLPPTGGPLDQQPCPDNGWIEVDVAPSAAQRYFLAVEPRTPLPA